MAVGTKHSVTEFAALKSVASTALFVAPSAVHDVAAPLTLELRAIRTLRRHGAGFTEMVVACGANYLIGRFSVNKAQ